MMAGVEIDGVRVVPVEVSVLEESAKMRVIIADGKKHEVREDRCCGDLGEGPAVRRGVAEQLSGSPSAAPPSRTDLSPAAPRDIRGRPRDGRWSARLAT